MRSCCIYLLQELGLARHPLPAFNCWQHGWGRAGSLPFSRERAAQ